MSIAKATAYRSRFAGRIASAGSCKSPQNKAFTSIEAHLLGKHIVSKIVFC